MAAPINPSSALAREVQRVPGGCWAVGVSGGADSVALLSLLRQRCDVSLHVVHLNHQTRGHESDDDARFVAELCGTWRIPCTIAHRNEIEPLALNLPRNPSARFRALRLAMFRRVVEQHNLLGVILAHHADDQAETVFQRLCRGSGYLPLVGMEAQTRIGTLTILRPLLGVGRTALRGYLREINQCWREDASNASDAYQRNQIRKILGGDERLTAALLELSRACAGLREWVQRQAPWLGAGFRVDELQKMPSILSRESARRWLRERSCPMPELSDSVVDRLLAMAADAAAPARWDFPGGVSVRRRGGIISVGKPA